MNKNYIPTIDVSKILDNKFNSIASKNIINKINKACVEVGFFQIIGHGIKLSNITVSYKHLTLPTNREV